MAQSYDKIRRELRKQKSIEGNTSEIGLLFSVLNCCKTARDWQAMSVVKFHKYGELSYQAYRFYYPSPLLLKIQDLFTKDDLPF